MWERTGQLTEVLTEIKRQWQPGLGVIVSRDNMELGYGAKCQLLLDSSQADYVCYLDDDDMIAPTYVVDIFEAINSKVPTETADGITTVLEPPDYIGFNVRYTTDGVRQLPVTHSLEYNGWINAPDHLYRDIVHFNPVRRELGIQSSWVGGYAADGRWCDGLRGLVKTQVFIDKELHYYQHSSSTSFLGHHEPMSWEPPRPEGFDDFVTWI